MQIPIHIDFSETTEQNFMKFAPAVGIGPQTIPVNFGNDPDVDPWIQIPNHFDFSETTEQILMKFALVVGIGAWMIQVNFGGDPDLDPRSRLRSTLISQKLQDYEICTSGSYWPMDDSSKF